MGPVLAEPEQPVDLVGLGIVAADGLVALDREVEPAPGEAHVVRLAAAPDVEPAQLGQRLQVDHGDAVAGAGHERQLPVRRRGHLVGAAHRGHLPEHRPCHRVDDGQGAGVPQQHQQPRVPGGLRRRGPGAREEHAGAEHRRPSHRLCECTHGSLLSSIPP